MKAEPVFPKTWQLDGFTTNVTSRQAGEPDPVVRELLQNCLDAAVREAGREYAEITRSPAGIQSSPRIGVVKSVTQLTDSGAHLPTSSALRTATFPPSFPK